MDGLSPLLQLCISSLASGLQVVWPTAADSSGSFCESFNFDKGQRNPWRVPSPSWCVNFLLAQQTEQTCLACLPVASLQQAVWESGMAPSCCAWSHQIMFNIKLLSYLLIAYLGCICKWKLLSFYMAGVEF